MEYSIGDKIGGRYEVHRIFGGAGRSGMGVVYVCYDHRAGRVLAFKTYQEGFFNEKLLVDHFKRGALAWIELERHPYIVRASGVVNLSEQLFLGLEYIAPDEDGRNNLGHHLHSRIPLGTTLTWGIQFCDAMEHARAKGITPHRDIKPDNLLITRDKVLKVSDFDLAGLWPEGGMPSSLQASTSEQTPGMTFIQGALGIGVAGTPPWMAPEQFDGSSSVQSDIYSFGIVLYQMCNDGALPFELGDGQSWEQVHKLDMPAELDSPLYPVIRRCLAKDPQARFGGSKAERGFLELRETLIGILQQQSPETSLPEPIQGPELEVGDLNDRGVSLSYLGLHREAIKYYKKAAELDPEHPPTYLNVGVALNAMGETEKAGKAYRKAMKLDPRMAEAHYNYALICKQQGRLEEVERYLRKAMELDPHMHGTYEQLGILASESGRHEEAIRLMNDAVRRDPIYPGYRYSLGVALEQAGRHPESLASYREAVRLSPNNAVYLYGFGNGYRHLGDIQRAVECWQRTAELDPTHSMARFNLGIAFQHAGDLINAYRYYHEATQADPTNPTPYYNLGLLLAQSKLFGEGAECFENFLLYAAEDPAMAQHLDQARQYVEMMQRDEQSTLSEMVHYQAVYNRGLAYLNLGRLEEARNWFEQALEMSPDYAQALCGMGIYHERSERFEQAAECYRKSLEVDPSYVIAWNNLGWASYLMGRYDEAAAAYRKFLEVGAADFPDWTDNARTMLAKMGHAE